MTRWVYLSLSTILATLVFSCQAQPKHVVIGAALSVLNQPSAELAVKEINDDGGLGGVPIELAVGDWEANNFDAEESLRWAQRFSDMPDLIAVIGHENSRASLTSAPIYNEMGVPQLLTISTHPAITGIGEWTFRLCVSDKVQAQALAEYAIRDWGKKRIAVFYVNDDYGRGLAELFESQAMAIGGEIVSSVFHRNRLEEDDKEILASTITRLSDSGSMDLVVLFQRPEAALWTIETIRENGLDMDILGADNLTQPDFLERAPDLLEGVRSMAFFFPEPEDARAMQFIQKFREATGRDPTYAHAFAYDAVYLVRDAVFNGGYSREGVKRYLDRLVDDETTVNGVAGSYRIGSDRDARRALYVVESHEGKYRLLKKLPPRE